jgi:undecaprenyl-diphosphatase
MPLFHIILLAIIQGITEFLPISSSGHLVLMHELLGHNENNNLWDKELSLDVAVHVGTLFAVLFYFRKDLILFSFQIKEKNSLGRSTFIYIILASIPVIAAGFILSLIQPGWLRSIEVAAWCTLLFGILLWLADKTKKREKTLETMNYKDALLIGLSQVLALIPGTSRSGITMTAARFLGFNRIDSARFSLFLGIIAISGAGTLTGLNLIQNNNLSFSFDLVLSALISFLAALVAISIMMKWLEKASFTPFVIYRVLLGVLLLGLIYSDKI